MSSNAVNVNWKTETVLSFALLVAGIVTGWVSLSSRIAVLEATVANAKLAEVPAQLSRIETKLDMMQNNVKPDDKGK